MNIIRNGSRNVEQENTAQAINSDVLESAITPKGVFESASEDEDVEFAEADAIGAKIHYYSRTIAQAHGITKATVLAGFAFKLKHHKRNRWKERYWYYDTLATLCKARWPYLSPSGLCGITEVLAAEKLLIKDCNNKASYDGTTWYAMDAHVIKAALSDSIWFDVRVAMIDELGIPGATIYHNIRYHLRQLLKDDPTNAVPYTEVNMKQLARDLPMSYATVKRMIKELVRQKLIVAHPTKKKMFTLAALNELGIEDNDASGSSANRNGSFTNGSSAYRNGSSTNQSGSSAYTNGSFANDYTQLEANEKTNEKPLRNGNVAGCVNVNEQNADEAIKHEVTSHPSDIIQRFVEVTDTSLLKQRITELLPAIAKEREQQAICYSETIVDACQDFFKRIDCSLLEALVKSPDSNRHLRLLSQPFTTFMKSWLGNDISSIQAKVFFHGSLQALVGALALHHRSAELVAEQFEEHCEEAETVAGSLRQIRQERPDTTAKQKATIFLDGVRFFNQHGWPDSEGDRVDCFIETYNAFNGAVAVFETFPNATPADLLPVLADCVEAHEMKDIPTGFDPFWHARNGVDLAFFFKHWPTIQNKMEIAKQHGRF